MKRESLERQSLKRGTPLRAGVARLLVPLALLAGGAAPLGHVVALTARPGSTLEQQALKLMASDIRAARHAHERPLVLVGSARIGAGAGVGREGLFVQVQSASLCGSAGCSTSVFLPHGHGWTRVLDSVSGPIEVGAQVHAGMHDLIVDGRDRWVWAGAAYRDTLPVPGPVPDTAAAPGALPPPGGARH